MLKMLKRWFGRGHFARLDNKHFPDFERSSVWLVGAGPGAPGLISLLGYHALGVADVIVYDALVAPELLALANPAAKTIFAGKRGGKPSPKQADISLQIIAEAKKGNRVLRLKGGDPFMFGRGGEEAGALHAAGVSFRIVPGITAGIGGLAYAGIPATHRDANQTVIFLTGHDETGTVPHAVDWPAVAKAAPVVVMYMAVKHLGSIAGKLMDAGRPGDDRVAIISNATLPHQSVVETRLDQARDVANRDNIPTPAIVVLGPASGFRDVLDWYTAPHRENTLG